MQYYTFREHFGELKSRLMIVISVFILSSLLSYYFSEEVYNILLNPLVASGNNERIRNIIYTGLTEAFFTYLKLAFFCGFIVTIPVFAIEIYLFIRTGLHKNEQIIAGSILFMSPILFIIGAIFVYYYVMPNAWNFFLSFENNKSQIPLILEARISEYINLVIQLIVAFGSAFQIPIIMLLLKLLDIVSLETLKKGRRFAILINFVIAGIITPPDVVSQFALAIPMILLYEGSLIMCKFVGNRSIN